ncbi:MAG: class I lanthipeptide [Hyphomicrobiales bacterium]
MKSLKLKKEVIANLNQQEMNNVEGGTKITYSEMTDCLTTICWSRNQPESVCKCDM